MDLELKTVYLLLGSNLGDRRALIKSAIAQIGMLIGTVNSRSSWYETDAWGKEDQPSFLNIAIGAVTPLTAHEVLAFALQIEADLGRVRAAKWGERLIDIDIILFGQEIIDDGLTLQVPHPRMQERKFVLEPLAEIAGSVEHPVLKKNISMILSLLKDNLGVEKIV